MNYYEVVPANYRFHGGSTLTYSSDKKLGIGQLVKVNLNGREQVGVVFKTSTKPDYKVKSISLIFDGIVLPQKSIELMSWLKSYYPSASGVIASQFVPANLLQKNKPLVKKSQATAKSKPLPKLTKPQQEVIEKMKSAKQRQTFLLHGETGSGKTRVYQELAKESLKSNKNVLVLAPEIALTAQLISSFEQTFSNKVVVLHSGLTAIQRREAWLEILQTDKPLIIIGPRSALFSPVKNLGLVVVDEAHEGAYKQDQSPYYYAPRLAAKLAEVHGASLVMGTATPSISDYYLLKAKGLPVLELKGQALGPAKAEVKVIDARRKTSFKKDLNISDELLSAIEAAIKNREQSLVFLNRRGTARVVLCQDCGWQALCPNCDLSLVYHGDDHTMRCHTCGHKEAAPSNCPVCKSPDIVFKSIGTKTIADSIKRWFPKAKIVRFDADNTEKERFEKNYQQVASGNVDILVGTQILAKGLDLPKLSLVGVIAAESSLYLPDYTAEERTYQLLSQVIGRVGRGHRPGTAIIQSFNPDSPVIKAAVSGDWQAFYDQQLKERELFGFPPFYYLLKLTARRKTKAGAIKAAENLHEDLLKSGRKIKIIGPSPAFHEKAGGNWQWQLVVKAKDRGELLKVMSSLPAGWIANIDPINLL